MLKYVKRNATETPFPCPADMPEALHRLLVSRGIGSAEAAEVFLHPDARALHDPLLLSDMAPAVERIRAAMAAGEAICVYGDYDVDGVCAAAILKLWLQAQGANVRVYLPSRHSEGYGLNAEAIRSIAGWAKLMVTVDCGVTSVELVALAKSLGLDVIVTDHHRPAETLPDCPVVDPLLSGYPFPHLCGAGVAWKVVWALSGKLPADLIDIAALATVADVVSLTGENRAIVAMGLQSLNRRPRTGIAALIEAAGLSGRPVSATAVAFQLAPRLNAGGRLGPAERALDLVTADDPARARELAEALDQENTRRRAVELQILNEAGAQLRGFDFLRHRAIILAGQDWNPGVIGLAASRLVEKYHYPTILLADRGDALTGSCRSIEGVDIHAALTGCAHTLLRFGGHRQAAGLTMEPGRLPEFIDAMDAWLQANVPPDAWVPVRAYDTDIDFGHVTPALIAALEALQPTGFGNPAPVFRARAEVLEARAVGAEGAHLKLTLSQDGRRIAGIAFREGPRAAALMAGGGSEVDALFVPKLNSYMGRVSTELEVQALAEADANARIASNIDGEWGFLCDFLTEIHYNKKIIPPVGEVDFRTLAEWLAERPQGTLVIAGDLACAAEALKCAPEDCPPDLFFAALPDDPRAFNAVCACPPPDDIPAGYRRVVLAGAPVEWLPEGTEAFRLPLRPAWMDRLPDLDAMRRAYRAMVDISRRPVVFRTLPQLVHLLEDYADLDRVAALLSVLAIRDMGLYDIDLTANPPRLQRQNKRKADPDQSPVWQAIERWREMYSDLQK